MSSHEILLAVLRVIDPFAWEAAHINDWSFDHLVVELDRRLSDESGTRRPLDFRFLPTRDSVTVAVER